jgi:HAD superfamily hydrolase (TIGR01490 family)
MIISHPYLVFCDVDQTLINCKSIFDFLDYYLGGRYGPAGLQRAAAVRRGLLGQLAAGVPQEQLNREYFRVWAGQSVFNVAEWGRRWHADRVLGDSLYLPAVCDAIARHRADGAVIALISGSFPAVLDPIAEDIGATELICVRPEVTNGVLTGEILGVPILGEAKRLAVQALLGAYPNIDPQDCYAYGDHTSDLPMLAEVGHPVVVGGDPELMAHLPGAGTLYGHRLRCASAGDRQSHTPAVSGRVR